MLLNIARRLHTGYISRAAETNLLAKLRKKTGYTISNCKKALEMHENDFIKAEGWLQEQAQSMGWSKATKLAGRATAQGLVGVRFDNSRGAVVEINCETDFVAKNDKFLAMVEEAANSCYQFANTNLKTAGPVTKLTLDTEKLGLLQTSDGKNLRDKLALLIGSVGENAHLKRAECWISNNPEVFVTGYTHPSISTGNIDFSSGKYGALLAYKIQGAANDKVGREICQHIVGMNPSKIGNLEVDKPAENSDDESCLIYQEFLLDNDLLVNDVLLENSIEIVDFVRFECGQDELEGQQQPLDKVETCQ